MDYKIELTKKTKQPVLSVRTRAPVTDLPMLCGKVFTDIAAYLGELGEEPTDAAFVAYYNMDMENLDLELGFPVSKALAGKGEIQPSFIPEGNQVSCMHKGSYSATEPAYNAMLEWIGKNGYEPTGASYEFYYNSPGEVPESELLTKIVFPLK
ncbi:MAG: GyrI-like domain-containing protein [Firmicutes bacterium]|nr:GyrI-like domain-containing protein [Bacillota bacterium]